MIIIHELGHFLFAKLFKVHVKEFSLFVGPKIWAKKYGETVYTLRTIPIAAYVKMEGEEEQSDRDDAYNKKPVWQRILIILGGPMANILSALVAIAIVFTLTSVDTTKISYIEEGSPAFEAGLLEGDRILSYDGRRTYTPTDFLIYSYFNRAEPVNLQVDRNGERRDLRFQPASDVKSYLMGASFVIDEGAIIQGITPQAPADLTGLKVGDEILSIDGQAVENIVDIRQNIAQGEGNPVEILVRRDLEEDFTVTLTPVEQLEEMVIGLRFSSEEMSFFPALKHSGYYVFSSVKNVGYTIRLLTSGKAKVTDMSGPIGIVATMNAVVSRSVGVKELAIDLLDIFAMISIAIGATNLIPFPPLDGSKLVFLGVEAIIRKPVPVQVEAAISMVGMALLLLLVVFITYADITKLFSGVFS
jgi:regulator of sigma E protease